ncbi:MAG: ABC transporter ATP-binding protein [Pseudomonadota bacterium]|nr:ABC transporter ATP-binding protein [Pseudomonadota bacterium]
MADSTAFVHIRGLGKGFGEGDTKRVIFDQLELRVQQGECIALLGRSGSGKSTLLNLISGIDLPEAGEIWIGGTPVSRLAEPQRTRFRRRYIGFVFQFFNLIPTLTVGENALLPLELNGMGGTAQRQRVLALLAQVGLGGRRDSFPERLSGGEQQRLAIVRALAHAPRLLLADEPTGNLDDATAAQVLGLLSGLCRQAGATVVLATHSREAAAVADRAFTLEAGGLRPARP